MPTLIKKMETRRLHNTDMKKLVRVLRRVPFPTSESKEKSYRKLTKEAIHDLPRRLRSLPHSVASTTMCSTHKGLDAHLINDIWAWVRHELDGAIGRFQYPLIVSAALTEEEEAKMRQLEPVSQMWHSDFKTETSAPPGHEPIDHGSRWAFQADKCPACMLARIGSSKDILFALFAGMVGRMKNKGTSVEILLGLVGFEKIKSKRLRFVRYWIRTSSHSDKLLFEAAELGLQMKHLRHEWKVEQRRRLRHARKQDSAYSSSSEGTTSRASNESERSRPSVDAGYQQRTSRHSVGPSTSAHDPKLGPAPRPSNAHRLAPAAALGFDMSALGRPPSNGSISTVRPEDSISSVGQLYAAPPQSPDMPSIYSIASTHTISSYNGAGGGGASKKPPPAASLLDPLDRPIYNTPQMQEQLVEMYRALLASHTTAYANHDHDDDADDDADDATSLPPPRPKSMYSAFGKHGFDDKAFDGADADVEAEDWEAEDGGGDVDPGELAPMPGSSAGTTWGDLY